MHSDTKRVLDVLAVSNDGATYRIERHCRSTPGAPCSEYYFFCLPDGQLVIWRGDGDYEMPDGTLAHAVASRLVS